MTLDEIFDYLLEGIRKERKRMNQTIDFLGSFDYDAIVTEYAEAHNLPVESLTWAQCQQAILEDALCTRS